eukprot:Gb_09124 [translate_table: standard]
MESSGQLMPAFTLTFLSMEECGMQPNEFTFASVLLACGKLVALEQGVEAIKIFQQMQLSGVKQDSKTFATVLAACADLADIEQGMEIHREIIRCGSESDVFVGTTLIDMYAKCGNIEKACHPYKFKCKFQN